MIILYIFKIVSVILYIFMISSRLNEIYDDNGDDE